MLLDELGYQSQNLSLGLLEIVIDNYMVEPWGKGELVSCLGHTLLDGLCTVGAPREEAAAHE